MRPARVRLRRRRRAARRTGRHGPFPPVTVAGPLSPRQLAAARRTAPQPGELAPPSGGPPDPAVIRRVQYRAGRSPGALRPDRPPSMRGLTVFDCTTPLPAPTAAACSPASAPTWCGRTAGRPPPPHRAPVDHRRHRRVTARVRRVDLPRRAGKRSVVGGAATRRSGARRRRDGRGRLAVLLSATAIPTRCAPGPTPARRQPGGGGHRGVRLRSDRPIPGVPVHSPWSTGPWAATCCSTASAIANPSPAPARGRPTWRRHRHPGQPGRGVPGPGDGRGDVRRRRQHGGGRRQPPVDHHDLHAPGDAQDPLGQSPRRGTPPAGAVTSARTVGSCSAR